MSFDAQQNPLYAAALKRANSAKSSIIDRSFQMHGMGVLSAAASARIHQIDSSLEQIRFGLYEKWKQVNHQDRPKKTRGRPRKANPKVQVTLRLDADVIEAFKREGPGWHTRINKVLLQSTYPDVRLPVNGGAVSSWSDPVLKEIASMPMEGKKQGDRDA